MVQQTLVLIKPDGLKKSFTDVVFWAFKRHENAVRVKKSRAISFRWNPLMFFIYIG